MKQLLNVVVLLIGLTLLPTVAFGTITFPCADNTSDCGGFDGALTESGDGPRVIGGGGLICRATWGQPATYCYIMAYQQLPDGTMKQICAQGPTNAGWCTCTYLRDGTVSRKGSCMFE